MSFQFSLRGWFLMGRPSLGTEDDWLVDIGWTKLSRGFALPDGSHSRRKGLRHTTFPIAEINAKRQKQFRRKIFKGLLQFLLPLKWEVSLEVFYEESHRGVALNFLCNLILPIILYVIVTIT
ncbi:MAG: hypothetical protein IBV52_07975 [Candidatus Bathyarchaeota archaeon]